MTKQLPTRLCGRTLSGTDLETIRREVRMANPPIREEVARRVCRALDWTDARGRPKLIVSSHAIPLDTASNFPKQTTAAR